MIVSFANQKGGVGKTTIALNLGSALALTDFRVLLVDFDPQSHVTIGLDIKPEGKTIYRVITGEVPIEEAIFKTQVDNLYVIPSDEDLAGLEVDLLGEERRQFVLSDVLSKIKHDFDFIFIDCPPSIGIYTVNALCASDYVVIPVLADFFSLEGFSKFFRDVEYIRENLNPRLDILGIVINMYDRRVKLAREVEEEFKKFFPRKIFRTYIPKNVKIAEAPSFGLPVVLYKPSSPGADAFASLADEFIERVREKLPRRYQKAT